MGAGISVLPPLVVVKDAAPVRFFSVHRECAGAPQPFTQLASLEYRVAMPKLLPVPVSRQMVGFPPLTAESGIGGLGNLSLR